jgi:tetratricopeptide (TPR) repeat protein
MNITAYIIFLCWIPIIFLIFSRLPTGRSLIVALITGWLYLPQAAIPIPGLPDYKRTTATSVGLLLASLAFSPERFRQLRLRWFDLPMLIWCITPFVSSMTNGLGPYDGFAMALDQIATWGLPYLIGRACFVDREGVRDLSVGIVIGGLSYVPLAHIELRLSPQIHHWVYGFSSPGGTWDMTIRYGGYRPLIFMSNGLEVGMYMVAASLLGFWLWTGGVLRQIRGIPFVFPLAALLGTTVMCKSTGALLLMIVGIAVLVMARRFGTRIPAIVLLLIAPAYCAVRAPGLWDGRVLVSASSDAIDSERSQSLEFRLDNENMLAEKAMERPVFGWAGWGRARLHDENGRTLTITDGLWIIALGNHGIVGLASLTLVFLLPLALLMVHYSPRSWSQPGIAPSAALSVLLALYMVDNLSNAMINLIYIVAAGALLSAMPNLSQTNDLFQSAEELYKAAEAATGAEATRLGDETLVAWLGILESLTCDSKSQIEGTGRTQALATGHERVGHLLTTLGRLPEALESCRTALALRKDLMIHAPHDSDARTRYADALNNLACLLTNRSDPNVSDPPRAVLLAREAVQIEPSHAGYQRTLGASYCLSNDWPAAIRALSRASILDRKETCHDHLLLAIAHAGLGDLESARACLRLAEGPAGVRIASRPDINGLHIQAVQMLADYSKSIGPETSLLK